MLELIIFEILCCQQLALNINDQVVLSVNYVVYHMITECVLPSGRAPDSE